MSNVEKVKRCKCFLLVHTRITQPFPPDAKDLGKEYDTRPANTTNDGQVWVQRTAILFQSLAMYGLTVLFQWLIRRQPSLPGPMSVSGEILAFLIGTDAYAFPRRHRKRSI